MAPLHMVGIPAEIFRREFPVARHDPFVHAAENLDAALAAIEEVVQIPGHLAEIFAQWRRLGIERGEEQPLVIVELRYRLEAPLVALQLTIISLLEPWHADQPPVIAIGPAVIGAGEARGITSIRAAQSIAAMPADIQESMHLTAAAAHHQ